MAGCSGDCDQVLYLVLASTIFLGSLGVLWAGASAQGSITVSGFDGRSVVIGFVLFVACAYVLGVPFGIPIILALLLREFAQVMAYRMLGHRRARFRFVPFMAGAGISDDPLKSDGEDFLVAIMGPALSLGPVAMGAALALVLRDWAPSLSTSLWFFAATCGAVNFVLLLPFAPFDGARCMRAAVASYWPALAPAAAVFMSTAMFTASLRTGSVALMVGAAFGAQSLLHRAERGRVPLKPDHGLLALAAYAFTMAAHFSAGWWLFGAYFR